MQDICRKNENKSNEEIHKTELTSWTHYLRMDDGNIIRIPGTYILCKKKELDVWWSYNRGKISLSYITEDRIEKLREMAYYLNCKVIGDEGEEY